LELLEKKANSAGSTLVLFCPLANDEM